IEFVQRMFAERPWLGRGPGTLLPSSYRLLDNPLYGAPVAGGAIGLAAIWLLFVVPYCVGRSARLPGGDPETRHLAQALASVFPAALVASGTCDSLAFSTFSGVLFIAIGAVGALWRIAAINRCAPIKESSARDLWTATPIMANARQRLMDAYRESGRGVDIRWIFGVRKPLLSPGSGNYERESPLPSHRRDLQNPEGV